MEDAIFHFHRVVIFFFLYIFFSFNFSSLHFAHFSFFFTTHLLRTSALPEIHSHFSRALTSGCPLQICANPKIQASRKSTLNWRNTTYLCISEKLRKDSGNTPPDFPCFLHFLHTCEKKSTFSQKTDNSFLRKCATQFRQHSGNAYDENDFFRFLNFHFCIFPQRK